MPTLEHQMNEVAGIPSKFSMSAEINLRFFRAAAKVCSVPIMVLLAIAALGPANWAPRTALGWQFDHFLGYFGITLFFCFAWPRPIVVGEPSWRSRHCLRASKLSRRIGQPIFGYIVWRWRGAGGRLSC
jgi:hypothetical protein